MVTPLRVLILEDNTDDADLLVRELRRGGFDPQWERVETREAMATALDRQPWDAIISDMKMPDFSGPEALAVHHARGLDTPFIIVSGTINEEQAVDSLRAGAHDFVSKQNLARLCPALMRELKEAENRQARREAEERNSAFADSANEAIIVAGGHGQIIAWNRGAERLFLYSAEEVLGQPVAILMPEPYLSQHREGIARFLSTGEMRVIGKTYEWRALRKDGSTFPVEVSLSTWETATGRFFGAIIRDITEREKLQEQFHQAQKMEAIGRLAGGVAHDFNNILTVILGYSSLMETQLGEEHPLRRDVREIRKAGERAAGLTRQLLAFSRKQILAPEIIDLNAVVANIEKMLRRVIGEDIALRTLLDPKLNRVKADPGRIEQAIMNLCVNARDAMPNGGTLTIETRNIDLEEAYAREHVGVHTGPHVMLAVRDTGIGMDAETRSHLFEPFFTTKEKGKGTGLGLSIVYGIVKQSDGHIWVYSEPGQGATFKFFLPRAERQANVGRLGAQGQTEDLRGTETILVVEDDTPIRDLTSEILRGLGYDVLTAANGPAAVDEVARLDRSLHLIVTDVVMPRMSGPELVARIRASHPAIRILYTSGYTDDAVALQGLHESGAAFLEKPFTPTALAQKIRTVLDEKDVRKERTPEGDQGGVTK